MDLHGIKYILHTQCDIYLSHQHKIPYKSAILFKRFSFFEVVSHICCQPFVLSLATSSPSSPQCQQDCSTNISRDYRLHQSTAVATNSPDFNFAGASLSLPDPRHWSPERMTDWKEWCRFDQNIIDKTVNQWHERLCNTSIRKGEMFGAHYLENGWRYRLSYNRTPIGNGTWGIKWSRDQWRRWSVSRDLGMFGCDKLSRKKVTVLDRLGVRTNIISYLIIGRGYGYA